MELSKFSKFEFVHIFAALFLHLLIHAKKKLLESLNIPLSEGGPMGSYHTFSHILLLSHQLFLTRGICNYHPHGFASFDATKNKKQKNKKKTIVFLLISIN